MVNFGCSIKTTDRKCQAERMLMGSQGHREADAVRIQKLTLFAGGTHKPTRNWRQNTSCLNKYLILLAR